MISDERLAEIEAREFLCHECDRYFKTDWALRFHRNAHAAAAARFWAQVDKTAGCWLWRGALRTNGYGVFNVLGSRVQAHRFSYELRVGPIPEGLTLDHVRARGCRHRHCVNPAHLEPVTVRENVLRGDGLTAVNARKTHCPNGHEFTPANTYFRETPRINRKCRACGREQAARRKQSRAAA